MTAQLRSAGSSLSWMVTFHLSLKSFGASNRFSTRVALYLVPSTPTLFLLQIKSLLTA